MEDNKSLEKSTNRELTPKNRLFLQGLLEGKSTIQAYREAGYEGSDHASYQLRSELKQELITALEAQGVDKAGLMQSIARLLQLPLKETEISIKHHLDLLKLLAKTLPQENKDNKPKITAFIVNNNGTNSVPPTIVDTTEA